MKQNIRIIAYESIKNGIIKQYGEGNYLGKLTPDIQPYKRIHAVNPCILLDNNKYIWGFQCRLMWLDTFNEKYSKDIKKVININLKKEILPLNKK